MKSLITLSAALALAFSTPAFANAHKEAPGMAATGAKGVAGCEAQATEKKLAGAAKDSNVKKCVRETGPAAS